MAGFHRLDGRSRSPVAPILIKDEGAITLRVQAGEDGALKRLEVHSSVLKLDLTVEEEGITDRKPSASIGDLAPPKNGAGVIGPIVKLDALILDEATGALHFHSLSLRLDTATMADGRVVSSRAPRCGAAIPSRRDATPTPTQQEAA